MKSFFIFIGLMFVTSVCAQAQRSQILDKVQTGQQITEWSENIPTSLEQIALEAGLSIDQEINQEEVFVNKPRSMNNGCWSKHYRASGNFTLTFFRTYNSKKNRSGEDFWVYAAVYGVVNPKFR